VTDFPYGLHSRAPKALDAFYALSLAQFAQVTRRAVVMLPHFADADGIIAKTPWRILRRFSWYTHTSLTRHIFVLAHA
jgi:tRNA G10  N-methylase Trm11